MEGDYLLQRTRSSGDKREMELLLNLGRPPYHSEPRWRSFQGLSPSEPLRFSKDQASREAEFFNSKEDGWEYHPLEWSRLWASE